MNKFEDYIKYIKDFHEKAGSIVEAKAKDYAGVEEPLRNFDDAANIAGVTPEQGLLVRMADKIARVRNLTSKQSLLGEVGEKLEDTLMDLSNYSAILSYLCLMKYDIEPLPAYIIDALRDNKERLELAFADDLLPEEVDRMGEQPPYNILESLGKSIGSDISYDISSFPNNYASVELVPEYKEVQKEMQKEFNLGNVPVTQKEQDNWFKRFLNR